MKGSNRYYRQAGSGLSKLLEPNSIPKESLVNYYGIINMKTTSPKYKKNNFPKVIWLLPFNLMLMHGACLILLC